MEKNAINELHRLTSAMLDGRLDEQGQVRLGEILRSCPEAQKLYLSYCDLHVELSSSDLAFSSPKRVWGLETARRATSPDAVGARSLRITKVSYRMLLGAVALLLAAWIPGGWLLATRERPTPAIAEIIAEDSAVWENGSERASSLGSGKIGLSSGQARLRMASGAEVSLIGPAEIELLDAKAIRIASGRVAVRVTDDRGIGFRIVTPTADVVDLGTEFGIEVDSTGATEVHVAEGVVVARPSGSTGVVPIMRREAARIDTVPGELASIGFDAQRFPSFKPARRSSAIVGGENRYSQLPAGSRVIFLGDQSTDLETHILLVNQALAKLPANERPVLFNAGVSLPLEFNERQFVDQVESLRPTHAFLEFGPEIAGDEGWSLEKFRSCVVRLVDRLEAAGIEPIAEVRFPLRPESPEYTAALAQFNQFLRELAVERGYRLADAEATESFNEIGDRLAAEQSERPTFQGFRRMAAAILASFGQPELPVDDSIIPVVLPGVLTDWKYQFVKQGEPDFNSEMISSLDTTDWKPLQLPQPTDPIAKRLHEESHLVSYRDRERGFATNLFRRDSRGVVAKTVVEAPEARDVFINTGATVHAVWVNGERFVPDSKYAWHAGRHRIATRLREGRNEIVVEAGAYFFLSVTAERDWPLPVPKDEGFEPVNRGDGA